MAQKKTHDAGTENTPGVQTRKTQYDRDRELVRGIFRFYEVPDAPMSFMFKKRSGEIERYDFQDGQVYEIPREVAEHINAQCWYPVHQYMKDESGESSIRIGRKVSRAGFQSLDFQDANSLDQGPSEIYTAEHM